MQKIIYMDNAATTKPYPESIEAMLPFFHHYYANPSSIYSFGQEAKEALTCAREEIAKTLNAHTNEIYFTSGGTESDNWALNAISELKKNEGRHIITTAIEHHAILHTCAKLEKQGFLVTYLEPESNGLISLERLEAAIRPDTILISVMFANNEIGTIEPIKDIGAIAKKHNILFHTDAVQAYAHIPIDVEEMNIDLLSASGHKFHSPKGCGFLYVKNGFKLTAFIQGGAQERKRRAGTENLPAIVGMATAAKKSLDHLGEDCTKVTALRDHMISRLMNEIPNAHINGSLSHRLPGNVNVTIPNADGELLLIMLDQRGICASSGSACASGSIDPSHVLLSLGLSHELAHSSLRLSLDASNTLEEVNFVVDQLVEITKKL